ncbi:class I SAM-dependent methyltransferase [Panacibacter ginsenosidivorans]|uniref:Class I SAM-dependent methyltransferase n=1 Tax=Panacibacter ginsenosidivorans TaxID=1813871 RepID=A0A5B8VFD3_9BACT|nr:class I SAM-dependent methyltransferase [Panacibacter ginsenosidivorans]QEC69815.1 class I SAM-dependent methyltransferase [Panacibacter ginsenosidivorans]
MNTREAYNTWAEQYDTNINKTRDLEAQALRTTLGAIPFDKCLEIGCGTGKNTEWLITKAKHITAVDLSEEMLAKAKAKINNSNVEFIQADVTAEWSFGKQQYDLVTFSLVLEHIENLDAIFEKVAATLTEGGYVYVGELHPFKQYNGSKARFETSDGVTIVPCYDHHVSDFMLAAKQNGLVLVDINEYFDDNDRNTIPRILNILFKKA